MILVENYNGNKKFFRGRFFWGIPVMYSKNYVIVTPTNDDEITDTHTVPANLIKMERWQDIDSKGFFSHDDYRKMPIKHDEELVINKIKRRKVLAVSNANDDHTITVIPFYTLKEYHKKKYDAGQMKKNNIKSIIYLPESRYNKESFGLINEMQAINIDFLEALPYRLTYEGLTILSDHITEFLNLYGEIDETNDAI
ncbi:hypothetical protein [Pectinatus frisingensis]|uniref:hypothetical protein n=1 Tax=Pectinatus frisingensis TaxID=865 RepID=UPI003D8025F5